MPLSARRNEILPLALCGFAPAEARGAHRHLRPGQRQIETRLDQRRFNRVAPARQAFMETVQAPNILWMLARSAELAVVAEIRAVDRLRLGDAALLQQKGAERMPRRLHPTPRLVVG